MRSRGCTPKSPTLSAVTIPPALNAWHTEHRCHLPGPLDVVGVQVHRGRRQGSVAQVVADVGQFSAAVQGMGGVGLTHLMGSGATQLLGEHRVVLDEEVGDGRENGQRPDSRFVPPRNTTPRHDQEMQR